MYKSVDTPQTYQPSFWRFWKTLDKLSAERVQKQDPLWAQQATTSTLVVNLRVLPKDLFMQDFFGQINRYFLVQEPQNVKVSYFQSPEQATEESTMMKKPELRPGNIAMLELLKKWAEEPPIADDQWWDNFEKDLRRIRKSLWKWMK